MTQHSAYVWHPFHCRWHHVHSITPIHSIYDVTSTSGMTLHPLYQTLHPLYLCHHNLSTDITPTFEWHDNNLLCDIICTIYNMTSNPCYHTTLLMTPQPLYVKPHPVCQATYTLYMRHHSHYLCPHTRSIDNITPNFSMTSHSPYMQHRLHYTRHHILILWPQTTVFMSSHPLYLTSCPLYLCLHIHSIDDITPTVFLRSHPL